MKSLSRTIPTCEETASHPHQPKWLSVGSHACGRVAIGISAHGIVASGVCAHGIISVGIISMGVFSVGLVSMGLVSAGLTTMGLVNFTKENLEVVQPHNHSTDHSKDYSHQH